jgi:uncharacterized membrane protein
MQSTRPGWIPRSAVLLACVWPLCLHAAILSGRPDWAPAITALMAVGGLVLWVLATRRAQTALVSAALATGLSLLVTLAPEIVLYAPPILINLGLALTFGSSLRAGRVPIITRFAALERPVLPADLTLYTRRLTCAWTAFFAAMAALSLTLAAGASPDTWSVFSNIVNYVLVGIFFAGEYVYRRQRFRQYRHATLIELARNVRRAGLLQRRAP